MHLVLDGRGALQAQLLRALKDAVLSGRLAEGARFPPTRQLAQELGMSRNTVLAAYEQLRAEGFMQGRVGAGSYVALPARFVEARRPPPAPAKHVAPQSQYARRTRRNFDYARIPGRAIPGVRYAFQYGVPLVNPLLTDGWARALSHAATRTSPNYPPAQGLPALRAEICGYLANRRGLVADPGEILIVSGTQQAIALTARVLLDAGDEVAIEEPQYNAITTVLKVHGANLVPVPVDHDGLRCDALPVRPPRLVCVTPSHQFPTGVLLSLPRRMELLDYARRQRSWIFEDDYDGEFRYDGRPHAALRALDPSRVIYVGTFSKALFPSLRLGYIVMPPGLRDDFLGAKWLMDATTAGIEQAALAKFMADGSFERHLRRTAHTLKLRREALFDGLSKHAGDAVEIADSHAGMHLVVWLRGRSASDGEAFIELARSRGLGLYSIRPYYLEPPDRAGLLMGYCGLSPAEIQEATRLFGRCLAEFDAGRRA